MASRTKRTAAIACAALAVLVVVGAVAGSRLLGGTDPPDAGLASQSVPPSAPASGTNPSSPTDADATPVRAAPGDSADSASPGLDAAGSEQADAEDGPGTATPDTGGREALVDADVPDWEMLARSVVKLLAPDCEQAGSGTIIGDGRLVLTNSHVLHAGGDGPVCEVYAGFTRRFDESPEDWQPAELVADDVARDLAVVRLAAMPTGAHAPLRAERGQLALGDQLTILGYPGFGDTQETLTFTSGRFSGTTTSAEGFQMLKTDALLDAGVSGGAVFDRRGRLIGVATGGYEGEGGTLGAVIPGREVLRFLAEHGLQAESGAATSEATGSSASAILPTVTFPEASVRDAEAEAGDLERRRSVIGLFERLRVEAERRGGYRRDAVFPGWLYSGGQSTRDRVLSEERLADGSWLSAYDAAVVAESSALDIDHLVPLAEAWESGGHSWTADTWTRFANDRADPRSLIAVSAATNRSKGARDPAEWWPPSRSFRCQYAADWIAVKVRWDLAVDAAEQESLDAQLGRCAGADFVFSSPAPALVDRLPAARESSATTAPAAGGCHPAYRPCIPYHPGDALNCGDLSSDQRPVEVLDAGNDPYRLDRDGDGIGCQ